MPFFAPIRQVLTMFFSILPKSDNLQPMKIRCPWVPDDLLYQNYHDNEWGVEKTSNTELFEQLSLEGAQAGLSWLTILRKREGYRSLFHHFDLEYCSSLSDAQIDEVTANPAIVRHRNKVLSVRGNAQAALELLEKHASLHAYFWSFIDHQPRILRPKTVSDYPTKSETSTMISKDLKKRGFNFVGPTTIYAFMQAVGMCIDHSQDCFKFPSL
jgi:DNA-3-methyladenine glycosylase I